MGAPTYAAQSRMSQGRSNPRNQPDTAASSDTAWDTISTPFRWAGRAGMTVVRSPMIVGETVTGQRKFISKDGMFVREEPAKSQKTSQKPAERHPLFPD